MSKLTELIEQLKREYPSELDLTVEELLDTIWFTIITSSLEEQPQVKELPVTPA